MKKKTDREMLGAAGLALHGPRFQRDLAEDLDVNERTVRRWLAGTSPVPDGIWNELTRLMTGRIDEMTNLVRAFGR